MPAGSPPPATSSPPGGAPSYGAPQYPVPPMGASVNGQNRAALSAQPLQGSKSSGRLNAPSNDRAGRSSVRCVTSVSVCVLSRSRPLSGRRAASALGRVPPRRCLNGGAHWSGTSSVVIPAFCSPNTAPLWRLHPSGARLLSARWRGAACGRLSARRSADRHRRQRVQHGLPAACVGCARAL